MTYNENLKQIKNLLIEHKELSEKRIRELVSSIPKEKESFFSCGMGIAHFKINDYKEEDFQYIFEVYDYEDFKKSKIPEAVKEYEEIINEIYRIWKTAEDLGVYLDFDTDRES